MAERNFQRRVIRKLRRMFPDGVLLKNDSSYQQGIPDWTLFVDDKYAILEIKDSRDAVRQPNQEWFVEKFNEMSFGAFIFPENEEEVLDALQAALAA